MAPRRRPIMARRALLYLSLVLLAGCSTISANPIQDVPKGQLGGVIVKGLLDATYNLDQAVLVGALPKGDPAPGCFHAVLTQLGVDPANPAPASSSFSPKVSD